MSNLPWFTNLTFQVPMQNYSLPHQILLSSPDTSTTECHFRLGPATSFFLGLLVVLLHSSLEHILDTFRPGGLIFQCHIFLSFYTVHGASLVAQLGKNLLAMRETWVQSLRWDDPLEKGKATHSSVLTWRIPWILQSMGSQRVGHDWATFIFTFTTETNTTLQSNYIPIKKKEILFKKKTVVREPSFIKYIKLSQWSMQILDMKWIHRTKQ